MTRPIQPAAAGRTLTLAKRHSKPTVARVLAALDCEIKSHQFSIDYGRRNAPSAGLDGIIRFHQRTIDLLEDLAAALRAEGGKR